MIEEKVITYSDGKRARAYYKRLMYQVLSDCKSHLVRTATAVVIALGAAYLQAQYLAFPGTQAWQRAATTVVVTVLVFVVYVLYYAVRAPWKLDTVRQEEMTAARLEVENLRKEHALISGTPPALDVTIQEIYIQPRLSRDYSHIAKSIEDNSIGDQEFALIKQYIDKCQLYSYQTTNVCWPISLCTATCSCTSESRHRIPNPSS